jgi:hypothetical protein
VYLTTGNPLPSDIETVINWLLNEPYVTAFQSALGAVCVCVEGGPGGARLALPLTSVCRVARWLACFVAGEGELACMSMGCYLQ